MKWPRDSWSILLQTQLTGNVLEVYSDMRIADCGTYDLVKKNILDCYEQVAEGYRMVFRVGWRNSSDYYMEFATKKEIMCEKWVRSNTVDTFGQLEELLLIEEFLGKCPSEVNIFIAERQLRTLAEAAKLFDEYELIHNKRKYIDRDSNGERFLRSDKVSQEPEGVINQPRDQYGTSHNLGDFFKTSDHLMTHCIKLKEREAAHAGQSRDRAVLKAVFGLARISEK